MSDHSITLSPEWLSSPADEEIGARRGCVRTMQLDACVSVDVKGSAAGRYRMVASKAIRADRRRIHHAVTAPEYRELWFAFPGAHQGMRIDASQSGSQFRVESRDGDALIEMISGVYRTNRRGKVSFTWRRTGNRPTQDTVVEMRLHGQFGNSLVTVVHRDLEDLEDLVWHTRFWRASLARLDALF